MESVRFSEVSSYISRAPCRACGGFGKYGWDQIAGEVYCPRCLVAISLGESDPIYKPVEKRPCAVCSHCGTVRYLTFPYRSKRPIEIDLCAHHLRLLINRQLGPVTFWRLREQLGALGLYPEDIFLLHHEFYDEYGRALRPVSG